MYKTDFACTYQHITDDNGDDSLLLYQLQFLQAFNLSRFDDTVINEITEKLYETYKDNKYIKKLVESSKRTLGNNNNLLLFRSYFGFDTFHLFHNILCSLISDTLVNETVCNKLLNL